MGQACSQEEEMEALGMDCFCKREATQMVPVTVKSPPSTANRPPPVTFDGGQKPPQTKVPKPVPQADSDEVSVSVLVDPTSPSIHQASAFGDIDTILMELDRGWHVDMTDKHGRTALHHAALNGNSHVAKLLIDRGARLDARAWDGKTPFNYAAENCKAETLRYLHFRAQERKKLAMAGRAPSASTPRHMTPPPSDGSRRHVSESPAMTWHQPGSGVGSPAPNSSSAAGVARGDSRGSVPPIQLPTLGLGGSSAGGANGVRSPQSVNQPARLRSPRLEDELQDLAIGMEAGGGGAAPANGHGGQGAGWRS